jgi:hypothetical protein
MSIVYTVGSFNDLSFNCYNADKGIFDPYNTGVSLTNTCNYNSTSYPKKNCFVVAYDSNYNVRWANKMGSQTDYSADQAYCVTTDLLGNVYVTGITSDASFNIYDSTNNTYTISNVFSTPSNNYSFIVKYSPTGYVLWVAYLTGETTQNFGVNATSIYTDYNNNVFVSGYFNSPSMLIYNGINNNYARISNTYFPTQGLNSCFLIQYGQNGNFVWSTVLGGSNVSNNPSSYIFNITTDIANNVCVAGCFSDLSFNIYSTNGNSNTLYNTVYPYNNTYYANGFLVKFDTLGNVVWATKTASTYYNGGSIPLPIGGNPISGSVITGIRSDYNKNVYISGTFGDVSYNIYDNTGTNIVSTLYNTDPTIFVNNYNTNGFIVKYDSAGNLLWTTRMGGTSTPKDRAVNIAVDISNNLYVTGLYNDALFLIYYGNYSGNSSSNITLPNTAGSSVGIYNPNVFIAQYNSNGNVNWAYNMGGSNVYVSPSVVDSGLGISVDVNNNIYINGIFTDVSFNVNAKTGGLILTNTSTPNTLTPNIASANNSFFCKYDFNGNLKNATNMGGNGNPFSSIPYLITGTFGTQVSANKFSYVPPPVICFKEDTKILTNKGYKIIKSLRKGDLVKTLMNGFVPINMIGNKKIYHHAFENRIKDQLYKCSKDKFPELFEDLIVTGCHSILIDEFKDDEQIERTTEVNGHIYITDGKYRLPACVDERTTVYEKPGYYDIYHIALDNSDYYMNYGIFANGLLVETCSKRYLKELSDMKIIE